MLRNIALILLFPLNWLWWFLLSLRRAYYKYASNKQHQFSLPVISVGNISHGGTGKTPVTLWIAQFFEREYVPVIATRGYKSQVEKTGVVLPPDALADGAIHGDEPALLRNNLQKTDIVIGAKRTQLLKTYFSQNRRDVLILEDGFQHLKVSRDLDILLVDAAYDIRETLFYPLQFREPLQALGDAQIVILTNCHICSEKNIARTKKRIKPYLDQKCEVFEAGYLLSTIEHCSRDESYLFEELKDIEQDKVLAFCGLAKAQNFWNSLTQTGINLSYKISFPDHHHYTRKDIEHILSKAIELEVDKVITTEKDIVKIKDLIKEGEDIFYTKVELSFYNREEQLKESLMHVIKHRGIEL